MPGSGDYFNQFLVDDFNSLDKEVSGHQWFQKEQERDSQRELAEQNELERDRMEEEKESPASTTADPFRPTYDRKKSTESKKDRLERIKKEYEHKPFISVGSAYIPPVSWEDLRKRRDRRKQVDMQNPNDSFKEGLSANSPNLTQEVEQNEPTILPMQRFESVKRFCKRGQEIEMPQIICVQDLASGLTISCFDEQEAQAVEKYFAKSKRVAPSDVGGGLMSFEEFQEKMASNK